MAILQVLVPYTFIGVRPGVFDVIFRARIKSRNQVDRETVLASVILSHLELAQFTYVHRGFPSKANAMAFPDVANLYSGNGQISPETEQKVADEARAAKEAQEEADSLKQQASITEDDTERDKLLARSKKRETEAHTHSKEARQMASSAWQGTVGGAGIGTGVGTGTGAVVGTLVGTIASIPMAGLGALIGLPVGLIHGPFVQTGGNQAPEDQPPSEDEQHRAVIKALDASKQGGGKLT
jgi:hypothetical protein